MIIDLHMHTNVSDGTDTPEEIIDRVREAGITLFSVTDHDAEKAARIIPPLLKPGDPSFITGAEFSCRDEKGKYHILGYGYDPDHKAMRDLIETGHRYRMHKVQARLDYLSDQLGFSFSEEDLKDLFAQDNPGKPHIGNLMVKLGYAKSKDQAIRDYINQVHIQELYVRPEEAIQGIREAGGISVLAHPSYGDGDQLILGDEMDARLQRLIPMGLQGLEAFYSGFTKPIREEVLSFAKHYGLYVTAGSDYHGKNKLVVLGDTGLTPMADLPEGLTAFLRQVTIHTPA